MANFGYEIKGSTAKDIDVYARACLYSIPENGVAQSITWWLKNTRGDVNSIKVAIWDSDKNLLVSGERVDMPTDYDNWFTVALDTNPELTKDAFYWLGGKAQFADVVCYRPETGIHDWFYGSAPNYATWPQDPLDGLGTFGEDLEYSVYCTYEPVSAAEATIFFSHNF